MTVYSEEIISRISKEKRAAVTTAFIVTAILIALIILFLQAFKNGLILFSEISLTVISIVYVIYIFGMYKLKWEYTLNYGKLLAKIALRTPDKVVGVFREGACKEKSDSGVTFNVLMFDTGNIFRGKIVLRELLMEKDLTIPFELNRRYEMTVVDNVILSYKEAL